jgi:putative transposase
MLRGRLSVSERWSCQVCGQHRSTQRREPTPAGDDAALRGELRAFSARRPRWGYRQAHTHLQQQGWSINRKRVQRVWRGRACGSRGAPASVAGWAISTAPEERLRAERPDHVWAFDFQFDQTADGHVLKLLNVVDEFTREALVMHTARSITADQTVAVLEALVAGRGAPTHIRCDNGPEMTAYALIDCWSAQSTLTSYIDPGAPWQNPFVKSFHSRVRDELLNVELFSCLTEAQVVIEDWREDYNQHRPHSALGRKSPAVFAAAWTPPAPAA